jgi:hypothetical protein
VKGRGQGLILSNTPILFRESEDDHEIISILTNLQTRDFPNMREVFSEPDDDYRRLIICFVFIAYECFLLHMKVICLNVTYTKYVFVVTKSLAESYLHAHRKDT